MLEHSLELDENHYLALFNKGVVLGRLGRTEESIDFYKLSISENSNYPYSYL